MNEDLVILNSGDVKGGVKLKLDNSILRDTRESVGLMGDNKEFDSDLIMHINSSIGTLAQNGICNVKVVSDEATTWSDLYDKDKKGSYMFQLVPLYIALSTKIIFDPPPPSAVQVYKDKADELLWRLKIAYE